MADDEKAEKPSSSGAPGWQETGSQILVGVASGLDFCLPYVLQYYGIFYKYYIIAKTQWNEYSTPEINDIVFGLFLCFYGGQFPALLAAMIAVRQSGQWPKLQAGFKEIVDQLKKAIEILKDDEVVKMLDTDKDGKVDFSEIAKGFKENGKGLIAEVTPLVLKKVDPTILNESITSVWAITIQVSVTLQSAFARQIALGMRIGDIASGGLKHFVVPAVSKNLNKEHKVWADWGFALAAKAVGVVVAMFLSKLVGGFHSALQGGEYVAKGIVKFGKAHGVIQEGNTADINMGLMYFFGLSGFWWQLKNGFGMNVLFKLILAPFLLAEWTVSLLCYTS